MTRFTALTFAAFLTVPSVSTALTFFADSFGSGSTVNSASPGTPTSTSTDYEVISSKSWNPLPSLASGHLRFGITNTTGNMIEVQARFPVTTLSAPGDFIQLSVTFAGVQGLLTQNSFLDV